MKKDNSIYLNHILDAIDKIAKYLDGIDYKEFNDNEMMIDVVAREIDIIGEAASNVDKKFQSEHDKIAWSKIIGMRNKIIHDYFDVDIDIIWDTCHNDLQELGDQIIFILAKNKK